MKHYFTKDVKRLVPLVDFTVGIRALSRRTGRKRADSFTLKATKVLDADGGFCVLREDATMYECQADTISFDSESSNVTVAGSIKRSLMAPDKGNALKAIRTAEENRRGTE